MRECCCCCAQFCFIMYVDVPLAFPCSISAGMGFLNPAAAMVEASREHVSAGGGGMPPLWRVRIEIPPLSKSATGDGATVKAAKQDAARGLLRQLEGLPSAGAAAARIGLGAGGASVPRAASAMLYTAPKPPPGPIPAHAMPMSMSVPIPAPGAGTGALVSPGGASIPSTGLTSSEALSSVPFRHGFSAASSEWAHASPSGASDAASQGPGSVAGDGSSSGRSASAGGFAMPAASSASAAAAAAAAAAIAAQQNDAMCRLNTRLQLMGFANPAAVLREVRRVHVSESPEWWQVEMAIINMSVSRVGQGSTVKEARKDAAAQLLAHLGEPPAFLERDNRATRGLVARELARVDVYSAAAAAAGVPGHAAPQYGPSGYYHYDEETHYPAPQRYDDESAAPLHEHAPADAERVGAPGAGGAGFAHGQGGSSGHSASETGEPAAYESGAQVQTSPEPGESSNAMQLSTPVPARSSEGPAAATGAATGAAVPAAQPKPSPGSVAAASFAAWQPSDDPAAFAPDERSPATATGSVSRSTPASSGSGGSSSEATGPAQGMRLDRGAGGAGAAAGPDGASPAADAATAAPGGGLLLLAAVAAAASNAAAVPGSATSSGSGSRATAPPPPLPLSTSQLHEFAELVRTLTSLPPAELAWEARLGDALLSLTIAFATGPHAPTNAIPTAAVREARLLSRLRSLWEQLERVDGELALASSLPDDDFSCASVMRALLWRVFGNAGSVGPLQQLAPSLYAFVGLPLPPAPR